MTETQAETDIVAVDGGDLIVHRFGSGPAVVLALHGITGHGRSFTALARALGEGYTVLAPDLRGRGASRTITGPFSMEAHADDAVAILDQLGHESAVVLGHSMGGFIAVVMAHRSPSRVTQLLLVDGGIPLDLPEAVLAMPIEDITRAVIGPALDRLARTFTSVEEHRAMWRDHPALAPYWDAVIEAYIDADLIGEPPELRPSARADAVLADAASELQGTAITDGLAGLQHPTALIRAERGMFDTDPLYAADHAAAFADTHPDLVEVVTIPDTNHYTIVISERGAAATAAAIDQILG